MVSPKMVSSIVLQPMTSHSDLEIYVDLVQEAFKDGLKGAMYPAHTGGFTTAARASLCEALAKEIGLSFEGTCDRSRDKPQRFDSFTHASDQKRDDGCWSSTTQDPHQTPGPVAKQTSPQSYLVKAVDTALQSSGDAQNGTVGIAKWVHYSATTADTMQSQQGSDVVSPTPPVDSDPQFANAWRDMVEKCKTDTMRGAEYVYLSVIVTREGFQRKGIGRKMMTWGLQMADDLCLPVYLEASPAGQPLYATMGFQQCGRLPLDNDPVLSHRPQLEHVLMVRPPCI